MDARGQTNPWSLPWNRGNEPGFFRDARDIKYFANTLVTRSRVTLQSPGHVFRQRLIVRQVPLSEFRRLIYPAILFWPTNTPFSYRRFYFRVGPLRHRSACRLWIENICAETGLILILAVCVCVTNGETYICDHVLRGKLWRWNFCREWSKCLWSGTSEYFWICFRILPISILIFSPTIVIEFFLQRIRLYYTFAILVYLTWILIGRFIGKVV